MGKRHKKSTVHFWPPDDNAAGLILVHDENGDWALCGLSAQNLDAVFANGVLRVEPTDDVACMAWQYNAPESKSLFSLIGKSHRDSGQPLIIPLEEIIAGNVVLFFYDAFDENKRDCFLMPYWRAKNERQLKDLLDCVLGGGRWEMKLRAGDCPI